MFRWIDTASLGTRLLLGLGGWIMLFAVFALAHFVSWGFAIVVGILAFVAVALLTGMRTYPGVRVYSADDTSSDDREIRRAIRRERRGRQ